MVWLPPVWRQLVTNNPARMMVDSYFDIKYEFHAPKYCDLEREMMRDMGEVSDESFVAGEEWFAYHHPYDLNVLY